MVKTDFSADPIRAVAEVIQLLTAWPADRIEAGTPLSAFRFNPYQWYVIARQFDRQGWCRQIDRTEIESWETVDHIVASIGRQEKKQG